MSENFSYTVVVPFFSFPKLDVGFAECVRTGLELGIKFIFVCSPTDNRWYEYLGKRNNMKVIFADIKDPGTARNLGLDYVETEWVSFWDADDRPNASSFLTLIDETTKANREIGAGAFTICSSNHERQLVAFPSDGTKSAEVAFLVFPGIWRFIFRFKSIKNIRFPALSMCEDQIFLAQAIQEFKYVYRYPQSVYEYQINSGQLTQNPKRRSEIHSAIRAMVELKFSNLGKGLSLQNKIFQRNVVTALRVNLFLAPRAIISGTILVLVHPIDSISTLSRIFAFSRKFKK